MRSEFDGGVDEETAVAGCVDQALEHALDRSTGRRPVEHRGQALLVDRDVVAQSGDEQAALAAERIVEAGSPAEGNGVVAQAKLAVQHSAMNRRTATGRLSAGEPAIPPGGAVRRERRSTGTYIEATMNRLAPSPPDAKATASCPSGRILGHPRTDPEHDDRVSLRLSANHVISALYEKAASGCRRCAGLLVRIPKPGGRGVATPPWVNRPEIELRPRCEKGVAAFRTNSPAISPGSGGQL